MSFSELKFQSGDWGSATLLKVHSSTSVFTWILRNFLGTPIRPNTCEWLLMKLEILKDRLIHFIKMIKILRKFFNSNKVARFSSFDPNCFKLFIFEFLIWNSFFSGQLPLNVYYFETYITLKIYCMLLQILLIVN